MRGNVKATDGLNYDFFFSYIFILSFCNVRSKYGARHKNHQIRKKRKKRRKKRSGLILFKGSFIENAILIYIGLYFVTSKALNIIIIVI